MPAGRCGSPLPWLQPGSLAGARGVFALARQRFCAGRGGWRGFARRCCPEPGAVSLAALCASAPLVRLFLALRVCRRCRPSRWAPCPLLREGGLRATEPGSVELVWNKCWCLLARQTWNFSAEIALIEKCSSSSSKNKGTVKFPSKAEKSACLVCLLWYLIFQKILSSTCYHRRSAVQTVLTVSRQLGQKWLIYEVGAAQFLGFWGRFSFWSYVYVGISLILCPLGGGHNLWCYLKDEWKILCWVVRNARSV